MARYFITYSCGHVGRVDIFGTNVHGERDKKEEWYKTCLCPDCYRAEQLAAAQEVAADAGLPQLVGSEKQVAWAEKIRAKKFEQSGKNYKVCLEKFKEIAAMTDEQFFANFKPISIASSLKNSEPQELKTREELTEYYKHKYMPYDFSNASAKYWIDLEN